ncbi:MAG: hypothetical protein PHF56_23405 [Desulfuromonadaceae bacterium]|nr:hypothetical protein [Desulfuromonadaceae bacterium]
MAIQRSPSQRSSAVTATFFSSLDGGIGLGANLLGEGIHLFGYAALYQALGVLTFCCIVPYYALYGRDKGAVV